MKLTPGSAVVPKRLDPDEGALKLDWASFFVVAVYNDSALLLSTNGELLTHKLDEHGDPRFSAYEVFQ